MSIKQIALLALVIFAVSSCGQYKKVNIDEVGIDRVENVKFSLSKLEADITLSMTFDNQSNAQFVLKSGNVKVFKGEENLFAELTTGQSDVLPPKTKAAIGFNCSVICHKPAAFVLSGLNSLDQVITDDMTVDAELIVAQGKMSKKISLKDIPLMDFINMINKEEK